MLENRYKITEGDSGKIVADGIDQNFSVLDQNLSGDEGFIKREILHPLHGKATGVKNFVNSNNYSIAKSISFNIVMSKNIGTVTYILGKIGGVNLYIASTDNRLLYIESVNNLTLYVYNDTTNIDKLNNLCFVVDNDCLNIYLNGKLFHTYKTDKTIELYSFFNTIYIKANIQVNSFISFNYALSQDEVAELYNNGRPDKVVLGNERKGAGILKSENSFDFSTWNKYNNAANVTTTGNTITTTGRGSVYARTVLVVPATSKRLVVVKGIVNSDTFGFEFQNTNNGGEVYREMLTKGSFTVSFIHNCSSSFVSIGGYTAGSMTVESISVQNLKCIAEYLPSSLTPTQWRDTSGNSNHLTASGTPELIYTPTYKEEIITDTLPTIKPDFSGQKWYDKSKKRLFIGL